MLDAVKSTHSFSVLLSAMEMTRTAQIALALRSMATVLKNHLHTCAEPLFEVLFLPFRASDCAATIQGWCLFQEMRCVKLCTRLSPPFCIASAKKLGGGLELTLHLFSICSLCTIIPIIRTQVQPSTVSLLHDHSDADGILHFKDVIKCRECKTIFAKSKLN